MEAKVITFGSILESTPEGLALMDRMRRAEDARRAALEPWEREIEDSLRALVEDVVLWGPAPRGGHILSVLGHGTGSTAGSTTEK